MVLETVDAVIDALGGNPEVAKLAGLSVPAVCNWRTRRVFPPDTYLLLSDALSAAGAEAPASLWGMKERASEAAE